jgi:hypothetical protein
MTFDTITPHFRLNTGRSARRLTVQVTYAIHVFYLKTDRSFDPDFLQIVMQITKQTELTPWQNVECSNCKG